MATKDGYRGDAFYVSSDGHFIGDDGFVVPRNFSEFFQRFPNYARNWVKKRLYNYASDADIEDWSQDLLIHLQFLPTVSKHRLGGNADLVQTFNPFMQYGASERRFRSFINFCLNRKFITICSKLRRNPLKRLGGYLPLSVDDSSDYDGSIDATGEYVHKHSSHLVRKNRKDSSAQEDSIYAGEFLKFVMEREPKAVEVLVAVQSAGGSFADARKFWCMTCGRLANTVEIGSGGHEGHQVGIAQQNFNRSKGILKELAARFVKK